MDNFDTIAVNNFRTYLRFPTVHPNPDYRETVEWLIEQASDIGLICKITEIYEHNPILIMCWRGNAPHLPSILLNSHMDVVPVEDGWTHKPFAAMMTGNGNIYARGAQDMKCVGIQYLEAIRRLKASGFVPTRTIYLSFVPDEELGGEKGMKPFVEGKIPTHPSALNEIKFVDMNVGFCLDEGLASPTNDYVAFYENRSPWWVKIRSNGAVGHGSQFIKNTAIEKLNYMITKILEFRSSEEQRMHKLFGENGLGNVVSANITVLRGGVQVNVVPAVLEADVDFRLPPTLDFNKFESQLNSWASEAGKDVELHFIQKDMSTTGHGCLQPGVDDSNPWWSALKKVVSAIGANLQIEIFSGATDARFLRRYHRIPSAVAMGQAPIEAINFSPMRNTPILLHSNDEFLNRDEFLCGVRIYTHLIQEISVIL